MTTAIERLKEIAIKTSAGEEFDFRDHKKLTEAIYDLEEKESEHASLIAEYNRKIASMKERIPEWISVKDRLPETDKSVIVFVPMSHEEQDIGYYQRGKWWDGRDEGFDEDVTHWTPLLPPPEPLVNRAAPRKPLIHETNHRH